MIVLFGEVLSGCVEDGTASAALGVEATRCIGVLGELACHAGAALAWRLGIRATPKQRRILGSVTAPAYDLGLPVGDDDILALIQSIDVIPTDFHLSRSSAQDAAVAECRQLLVNGSIEEGERLWDDLVGRARSARLGHGTIEIADLWRDLRRLFQLKGLPDFSASWDRLRAISADCRSRIESTLPSGFMLERKDAADGLEKLIAGEGAFILHGDSGTGKSALAKEVLDSSFLQEQQIWLGPDEIAAALSEVERSRLDLDHALLHILDATPWPGNVLVIDAAERMSPPLGSRVKSLLADLLARKTPDGKCAWRLLIIGQTEAWVSGQLQDLSGVTLPSAFELKPLAREDVRRALRSTDKLRWLASYDEPVAALTNLRALGWVIEAAPRFEGQPSDAVSSLAVIADRLWSYWTAGDLQIERLLMRLGEREAAFEHSFALTDLDAGEVAALGAMPPHCPLRRNSRNRYEFQHDLASDWARFQWLKQIVHDTARWAALASNPLWNGALRMLGQFLLREREGARSAWDAAFEQAEQGRDAMPLAADILLDALCLDPEAEAFLNERVEMLFADHGRRLNRLLRRFDHIATVPGVAPEVLRANPTLSLYMEAQLRTPIFGRWPPLAKFLSRHRARTAALLSPVVAALCERWLTSTPFRIGDQPTAWRREFAELAYSTARELQFEKSKANGIIFADDSEAPIYRTALLGAFELPDDVAGWALEMAQRRALQPEMVARLQEHRREEARKHAERLKTDPVYRERFDRKQRASGSGFLPHGRRLPPWPLGPRDQVDRHFSVTVLHSGAGHVLMRVRPELAAEVLLGAIIEDSPEEPYGQRTSWDDGLGLEYDQDSYPTAYWKSPFYAFFQIDAEAALTALLQLVEFSTERWENEVRRERRSPPPGTTMQLADGALREFAGTFRVFNWSQTDSHHIGQLTSALAALERWHCDLIDRGVDITGRVDGLLRRSRSVAVLGVLVNIGKYKPELLKGPLRPLLAIHHLYLWDYHRARQSEHAFDGFSWLRHGKEVFELAQAWVLAPHRKAMLSKIVPELFRSDPALAEFMHASTAKWRPPEGDKEEVEFRILVAELDHRNYRTVLDQEGRETVAFQYPADVREAIQTFEQRHAGARQTIFLPEFARRALLAPETLAPEQAAAVDAALSAIDEAENNELDDDMRRSARAAAAATLLVKAPEWLAQNPAAEQRARSILDATMAAIDDAAEPHPTRYLLEQSTLEFTAHAVALAWIANPSAGADQAVMRIVTSGDDRAVRMLVFQAFHNRALLGPRWWRLLQMALWWSGLRVLAPRHGDDDEAARQRWRRRVGWLRNRRLIAASVTAADIDPLDIARRVEKFERRRWEERYAREGWRRELPSGRRFSGGLNTHFLQSVFFWLLSENAMPATAEERAEWTAVARAFWAFEAWCRTGSADDDDDYQPLSQMLGYQLVSTLARFTLDAPLAQAPELWRPVLELGPRGHYAVGSFLSDWFALITAGTDIEAYAARWRPMIEYILSGADWTAGRFGHYARTLERQILGFGADSYILRAPGHASLVGRMRDLYQSWAEKRLHGDEDDLAGFCSFLSSGAGRVLRLDALLWMAAAVRADAGAGSWYRDRTRSAFMEFLDVLVAEHADELSKDPTARQGLIDLVAHAAARQIPAALALQERIRARF